MVRLRGYPLKWGGYPLKKRARTGAGMGRAANPDRSDEFVHYPDVGCEESPSCLACPLPACRYEDPFWYQSLVRHRRDAVVMRELKRLEKQGLTSMDVISAIAEQFEITDRTVFRVKARFASSAKEFAGLRGVDAMKELERKESALTVTVLSSDGPRVSVQELLDLVPG